MTPSNKNLMELWTTVAGLSIKEALSKLNEILPPSAYKNLPGPIGLTDIDPAYLTQVATQAFGLCGFGWTYHFDPAHMVTNKETRKTKNGERDVYAASLGYLQIQYRYVTEAGELYWSEPIPSTGYSENDNEGYAMRGAVTNALGAAWGKACWQLPVYLGIVDANNAGKLYAAAQDKKNGKKPAEATTQPAVAAPVSAPQAEIPAEFEPEVQTPAPVETPAPAPAVEAPAAQNAPVGEDVQAKVSLAKTLIIPAGVKVPMSGKTLGEASKDPMFGLAIMQFLAGTHANASGDKFVPQDKNQERLSAAAQLLLEVEPPAAPKGKK